jgi:hypothetical protein
MHISLSGLSDVLRNPFVAGTEVIATTLLAANIGGQLGQLYGSSASAPADAAIATGVMALIVNGVCWFVDYAQP